MSTDTSKRVIEILDNKSILINYGSNDGAQEGDLVRIIKKGEEVVDPYTKENLGFLNLIKDTLTIETVYDRFSICQKIIKEDINPLTISFNYTTKKVKNINVNEKEISNRKLPEKSPICIGDLVEII